MKFTIRKASDFHEKHKEKREITDLKGLLSLRKEFKSPVPEGYMLDKIIINCKTREVIIYDDYIE